IRQLAHDLIFGGGGGSLVKSGNEVDFLANAEFVTTHISRTNKRTDLPPYPVPLKLPRPINVLRGPLPRWLRPRLAHLKRPRGPNRPPFGRFKYLFERNRTDPVFCAAQHLL